MSITFKTKNMEFKRHYITLPVGEFANWRANAQNGEVFNDELEEEVSGEHMHEIMPARTRPVFDFDMKDATAEDYEQRGMILQAALDAVKEQFPQALFPKAKFLCFDSSSLGKISMHFHVKDVGAWVPSAVAEVASRFHIFKKYWDLDIYKNGHSLRMPYCTKEGEQRYLKRAELVAGGVIVYDELRAYTRFKETYEDWLLASNEAPYGKAAEPKPEPKPVEEDSAEPDENWKKWSFEKAKEVIDRLHDTRAATHKERTEGICSILHLGKALRKTEKFRELAHLFAKKDPEYSEAQTDTDFNYFKRKAAGGQPRTFASLIKFAQEDNPVVQKTDAPATLVKDLGISYYDKKRELMAKKPKRQDVEKWMLECLRYSAEGEEWYARSSKGGWSLVRNKRDNFPFGSISSNTKFEDTTFFDILQEIKDIPEYAEIFEIERPQFYPLAEGEKEDPNAVNMWTGWEWEDEPAPTELSSAVIKFRDTILELFPLTGNFILNCLTRKLRNPREKCKLIIGYGRFGGEGKNTLENILQRVFGKLRCISTADPGHILGKGEQGFNGGIQGKLLCFLQEAKAEGKSITDDDKFKTFLSESTYALREMNKNPVLDNPNYIWTWLWSNNPNCVKMKSAMLYRTVAEAVSAAKMEDKAHFAELRAMAASDEAIQEIFTWLWHRDISKFDVNAIPDTPFKKSMAEDSLSTTQRYVVDLCNNRRDGFSIAAEGVTKLPKADVYSDYKQWAETEGIQPRYRAIAKTFIQELSNMDIPCKPGQRIEGERVTAFLFDPAEIEAVMRKFQRDKEWKLLVEAVDDEDDE